MANALTLTASSLGRASQPSGAGAVLYVDGDNAVTIDAWPQPSRWIPDHVQLFRGDQEVRAPQPGDEWRWVLDGDERFGVFRAVARAGATLVESAPMVVQPTPVTVLASPADDAPGPHVRPSRLVGSPFGGGAAATTGASSAGAAPASGNAAARAAGVGLEGSGAGPGGASTPGTTSGAAGPWPVAASAPAASGGSQADADPGSVGGTGSAAQWSPAGGASGATGGATLGPPDPGNAPLPAGSPTGAPGASPVPSAPRTPAHASAADIAAMVEVPRGEYDGRFAAFVGTLFTVLSVGVIWYAATRLLGDPDLFATSTPPAEAVGPDAPAPFVRPANVADRIGLGTSTMVLALGVVVILAGAALAALEVRARLLRRDRAHRGAAASSAVPGAPVGPSHTATTARGTPGALRHVAVIVDRISQPRAVIAVLVIGGCLVVVGFLGQLHWALQL